MQMTPRQLLMEPRLVGGGQWGWEVVHRDKKVSMEIWGMGGLDIEVSFISVYLQSVHYQSVLWFFTSVGFKHFNLVYIMV